MVIDGWLTGPNLWVKEVKVYGHFHFRFMGTSTVNQFLLGHHFLSGGKE